MGERSQETLQLKKHTASSFGFEWSKFNEIYEQYEDNFLSYINPITKEFFKGKTVLDAGCGAGRHTYFVAKYGSELVVGIDGSNEACESAKRNTRSLSNVAIICKDIYELNNDVRYDYVMSIGVLHHLDDPESGFNKLVSKLKEGGTISIWVYSKKDNWLALHVYEPIRQLTTMMPYHILYYLAIVPAIFVQLCNWLRIPIFTHYRNFPFMTKWNDSFDVFSAPSAKYYTIREIIDWYKKAGLINVQVSYRMLNGKVKGIKAMGVK